jgi:DNA replication protein DnaC
MMTLQDYLKKYPQGKPLPEIKPKAPACPTCHDLGFVRVNYEQDHPLFGRVMPCPDCKQRGAGQADEYGSLPADRGLSWAGIYPVDPSITAAQDAIRQTIDRNWGWVYLWGAFGAGKTAMLKIATAEYLRAGGQAVYLRMADLMDDIRQAYDAQKPQTELQAKLRWFSGLPLLAIDEAEKVQETGFVDERRFQILDARYEAATRQEYGITLLAANVPPEKLPGALASRIKDGRFTVVHITANDVRPVAGML